MQKIALIPSYEPDEKLISLVDDLKNNNYEIIVVNDGSNSNYDKIFSKVKRKVKLISYKENKGKGYALKEGFKYIKENYKDYVCITMDCDGQHKVSDADKLYDYCINHKNQLVLGKRLRGDNTPLRSKLGNTISMIIYKLITKNNIYDTQTGLRAFSNNLMDYMLSIDGNRYDYEMNMLLNLNREKIKVKEIQIETIYIDNNIQSHFRVFKDSYLVYKQIIKYMLSSLFSFIVDYLMYTIFSFIFNITLSNIFARIISSIVNYNINKNIVFKNDSKYKSIIGYFSLVIIILLLNTLILNMFTNAFSINKYIAKVITEIILSIISYLTQKYIIFKKEGDEK